LVHCYQRDHIVESERDEISADHQAIIDALKAGDTVVAGEIVAQHVLTPGE
jgi:DNA-binding GntR family transcriptional regulator